MQFWQRLGIGCTIPGLGASTKPGNSKVPAQELERSLMSNKAWGMSAQTENTVQPPILCRHTSVASQPLHGNVFLFVSWIYVVSWDHVGLGPPRCLPRSRCAVHLLNKNTCLRLRSCPAPRYPNPLGFPVHAVGGALLVNTG